MTTSSDGQFCVLGCGLFSKSTEIGGATSIVSDDTDGGSTEGGTPALPSSRPNTLSDALVFARQHGSMSPRMVTEVASAVKLLEKVTGLDADQLPAAPKDLTPIIERAFPARHRIEPKRWSNAISSIRALLRACGLHAPLVRRYRTSNPMWDELVRALPIPQDRARMLGFACWCADAGVQPKEVTEQTLVDYGHFRETWTIRTHLVQLDQMFA